MLNKIGWSILSLKIKIIILHIIVTFVTAFFIYMIYDSYIVSQKEDINKKLIKVLKLNEQYMKKSLLAIQKLIKSKKDITKKVHLRVHKYLKENRTIQLNYLRTKIKEEYPLTEQNLDIEIFLVNKVYTITNSSHPKNIGYSLLSNEKSKKALDTLEKIDQYNRSEDVSVDFLDYEMKSFSYSKLDENHFLGIGIIYKDSVNQKKDFKEMIEIANTNMDMFCVIKYNKNNQYYESLIAHKKNFKSNEKYLNSKKKFSLDKDTDNFIINTARTWEIQNYKNNDILTLYVPLIREKNPFMGLPGDIILKIDLDIKAQNIFTNAILNKLIIFLLLHFLLVFMIFYFTNKYQKIEKELEKELSKNQKLINYNKQFISNTVHQIRTPLAVIMTNISLLERLIEKDIKQYSSQINASINLLSNSYENLSYFISNKSLNYHKQKLDLSSLLEDRIRFFEHVVKANKKNILKNIDSNLPLYMNDIELERIIDNSIANMIYYCEVEQNIFISLINKNNNIVLKFKTKTKKEIKKTSKTKRFIIKDTSSFGLGVYLIETITNKYNIKFKLEKKDNNLTIEYIFMKGN